jgi:hypothetical protein
MTPESSEATGALVKEQKAQAKPHHEKQQCNEKVKNHTPSKEGSLILEGQCLAQFSIRSVS